MTDPRVADAFALVRGLVLESGQRWGDVATEWQRADVLAVLDPDGPRFHFQTRPRGGSKTADLAAVLIALLLQRFGRGARLYAVAADRDQGALLIDSIAGFVERTPGLKGALAIDRFKVTAKGSRATLEVLAADSSSAWGLRPSFLVVDELAQWRSTREPRAMWAALHSATGKNNARMVVLTSAGDPAHWSHAVLEAARESDEWRVSETPGPLPWASERWLAEQRRMLPPWMYERLHLNRWTGADDRLTSMEHIAAAMTLAGDQAPKVGVDYVVSLDIGLTNDRTVAVVAHLDRERDHHQSQSSGRPLGERARILQRLRDTGVLSVSDFEARVAREAPPTFDDTGARVIVDRLAVWQGTRAAPVSLNEVHGWLLQAWSSYNRARMIFDPFQAASMTEDLRGRGVTVHAFNFSATSASIGKLALTLYQLLRQKAIDLPDDEDLRDELANVRLVERSPGVMRIDHDPGRHDDRAIAIAMAATHLLEQRVRPSTTVSLVDWRAGALRGRR